MISNYITFLVFGMCFALSTASRPMPTPEQLAYQHMEIGAMISFDMYTFAPNASLDYVPSPEVFTPEGLDTDTWLQAAQYFHAKYAVLTAKHDVGFCLWPTQAPGYNYSIQYTSWGHGKRDIVKEFIASCKKFNIKPAIYYSIATNFYKGVSYGRVVSNNTEEQQAYNELALFQLSELWTNYGDLVELWFDGGLIPVSQGGPDVAPLIEKLQPNAVAFNAPDRYQQCVRWIGNEDGIAYGPTWSTCDADTICVNGGSGSPTANFWCPAECDTPLRGNGAHQWFWLPDGELYVKTLDQLHDEYLQSVGHNCNYLLNINPNQQGLVDAVDMQRYVEFGAILSAYTKDNELASISGVAYTIQLPFEQPTYVDTIMIQEDQSYGELVYNYTVSALVNGNWVSCSNGSSIGHKKIDPITPVLTKLLQLQVTEAADIPHILRFAAYFVGPTKRYEMQP